MGNWENLRQNYIHFYVYSQQNYDYEIHIFLYVLKLSIFADKTRHISIFILERSKYLMNLNKYNYILIILK